ncbi:MAG TPA: ATP-binding protein [Candidatus Binatia bacterium]
MKLRPTTLRGRLTLWYSAVLTATLALLVATSMVLLDRGLRNTVDDSLNSLARAFADSVRSPASLSPEIENSLQTMLGPELAQRFFQLLDPFGQIDPRLSPPKQTRLPLSSEALHNAEKGQATFETIFLPPRSRKPFRLMTMPVMSNGAPVNIVQVAMSLENVDAVRSSFLLILLCLTPIALLGAGLGGWLLARRALTPVDAIVAAARTIEAEDLSRRLPALSQDAELGRLTAVLNDMLERIEAAFASVRRFSADAAHELRTPLTILKGEIELALRTPVSSAETKQTLLSCLEEVDRLNSLVEDLLLMARIESNALSAAARPVNLAEVMEDVAPALTELAARAGNHCTLDARVPLWVRGHESLLFRLIFNLAENAIKYTPPQGSIAVSLKQDNGSVIWEVSDTGPGIAPEAQQHLFDRFYRADQAREGSGTGLGLALVSSIVQLHHGTIELSSAPGKGSRFRVTLPLAARPSED